LDLGYGTWNMENGKWKMENGKWKMENGKWKMENVSGISIGIGLVNSRKWEAKSMFRAALGAVLSNAITVF
jgi:hypothetical protein